MQPENEQPWQRPPHEHHSAAVDRLADLAENVAGDPGVRRGVRIFGTLIGIQMVISIIAGIVALIFFIVIATKVLGSSDDGPDNPDFGGLGTVQLTPH